MYMELSGSLTLFVFDSRSWARLKPRRKDLLVGDEDEEGFSDAESDEGGLPDSFSDDEAEMMMSGGEDSDLDMGDDDFGDAASSDGDDDGADDSDIVSILVLHVFHSICSFWLHVTRTLGWSSGTSIVSFCPDNHHNASPVQQPHHTKLFPWWHGSFPSFVQSSRPMRKQVHDDATWCFALSLLCVVSLKLCVVCAVCGAGITY